MKSQCSPEHVVALALLLTAGLFATHASAEPEFDIGGLLFGDLY